MSFRQAGRKVIDLVADFRLKDPAAYERWYCTAHPCPELLKTAVYGLPESHREAIRAAQLVASPGCYPTAALLSLLPMAREGLLKDLVSSTPSPASRERGQSGSPVYLPGSKRINRGVSTGRASSYPRDRAGTGRDDKFYPSSCAYDSRDPEHCLSKGTKPAHRRSPDGPVPRVL